MRTVAVLGAEGTAAARRAVEATGAKVAWEIGAPLASARFGLLEPRPLDPGLSRDLGIYAAIRTVRTDDADLVVVSGRGKDAVHAAFQRAAMEARRRVTIVRGKDSAFVEAALDAARDYPQLSADAASAPLSLSGFDVVLCEAAEEEAVTAAAAELAGGIDRIPVAYVSERAVLYSAGPVSRGPATLGMLRAGALLLEGMNEHQACERLRRALSRALEAEPLSALPESLWRVLGSSM